jgi:hypothetical protein
VDCYSGRDERASLRRTNRLASSGLGENHVPEVIPWNRETYSNEMPFPFFSHRGYKAFRRLVGHLVVKTHGLSRRQAFRHEYKRAIGAYRVRCGFQVDGVTVKRLAANREGYLQGYAYCVASFGVSRTLHKPLLTGLPGDRVESMPRMRSKNNTFCEASCAVSSGPGERQ